jgi:hypothetical protein
MLLQLLSAAPRASAVDDEPLAVAYQGASPPWFSTTGAWGGTGIEPDVLT